MKHVYLGLLFIMLILSSCKDDDDENGSTTGNQNPQPTAGTVSATINGQSFSGNQNVTRYLSYGDFIIKSEDEGNFLNFKLDDFVGNATYSLAAGLNNSAEYYTTINGEFVGFESISGELVISEYSESNKTYNASFTITFARIGNASVTITGEGNFNGLKILEMTEPASGEVTAFYSEGEYYEFVDSVLVFDNGAISLNFTDPEDGFPSFSFASSNAANPDEFSTGNITLSSSEIIHYNYDEENNLVSGRLKNTGSDTDLEIWFKSIPVDSSDSPVSSDAIFTINGEVIIFDFVSITEEEVFPNLFSYQLNAAIVSGETFFLFLTPSGPAYPPGLNHTIEGEAYYQNETAPETNILFSDATMILEPGFEEGTANVEINVDGGGVFTASSVEVVQ